MIYKEFHIRFCRRDGKAAAIVLPPFPGEHHDRKLKFSLKKQIDSELLAVKRNALAEGSDAELKAVFSDSKTNITVYLLPADTDDLTPGTYYYDISSEDAADADDYATIFKGRFELQPNVARIGDILSLPPSNRIRYYQIKIGSGTNAEMIAFGETLEYDEIAMFINKEVNGRFDWINGEWK